nr:M28 family peptidase [Geomonas sp. RF6]
MQEILGEVSQEQLATHIQALEGVRHPTAAAAALDRAADYIQDFLQSLGYRITEHCVGENGCTYLNIVASRWGLDEPQGRVMVVAHYDTVSTSPGADDNASGVAVLLELARVLKPYQFDSSLEFVAVTLEENAREDDPGSGLRGSTALAQYAQERGWDIKGVVVLESVAYAGPDVQQNAPAGVPVEVPKTGDFLTVIGNDKSAGLVKAFNEGVQRNSISLPCVCLVVPGNGEVLPDTRRSDHAPFWDRGYQAIMLTDTTNFRNPNYHNAGDTFETLNMSFATDVCKGTAAMVIEVAGLVSQ